MTDPVVDTLEKLFFELQRIKNTEIFRPSDHLKPKDYVKFQEIEHDFGMDLAVEITFMLDTAIKGRKSRLEEQKKDVEEKIKAMYSGVPFAPVEVKKPTLVQRLRKFLRL